MTERTRKPPASRRAPTGAEFAVVVEGLRADFRAFGEALQGFRTYVEVRFDDVYLDLALLKDAVATNTREIKGHGDQLKGHGVLLEDQGAQLREHGALLREHGAQLREQHEQLREQGEQMKDHGRQLKHHGQLLEGQGKQLDDIRHALRGKVDRDDRASRG